MFQSVRPYLRLGGLSDPVVCYQGALVADSVVPAWHEARRETPVVFAGSAAAAAGGAQAILTPAAFARPARRLAVLGGVVELAASEVMKHRLGDLVGRGRLLLAAQTAGREEPGHGADGDERHEAATHRASLNTSSRRT